MHEASCVLKRNAYSSAYGMLYNTTGLYYIEYHRVIFTAKQVSDFVHQARAIRGNSNFLHASHIDKYDCAAASRAKNAPAWTP